MGIKRWKFRLEAKTPFYIGGHRIIDNQFETLDYVPATVVQAAFSKAILESHGVYDVRNLEHTKKGKYYLDFDETSPIKAEDCAEEWLGWFNVFNELSFSDAAPMGAEKYSPSTYACKTHGEKHGLVETLPERYSYRNEIGKIIPNFHCRYEGCGGRLERKDSWKSDYSMIKRNVTRVEIDRVRKVSRDERLFSITIGEPYAASKKESGGLVPVYFEGTIFAPEQAELGISANDEVFLHVGGYTSTGLGKMLLTVEEAAVPAGQDLNGWNTNVQNLNPGMPYSVALQFLSDCAYTGPMPEQDFLSTDDYNALYSEWLRQEAGLPADCAVSFAYIQTSARRGFKKGSNQERAVSRTHYVQSGSVIVIDTKGEPDNLVIWVQQALSAGLTTAKLPVALL